MLTIHTDHTDHTDHTAHTAHIVPTIQAAKLLEAVNAKETLPSPLR